VASPVAPAAGRRPSRGSRIRASLVRPQPITRGTQYRQLHRLRKSNLGSLWSEGWHWCAPSHRRSAHVLQSLTQPCHKSVTNGGVGGPKSTHQAARSRALYAQNRTGAHHAAPLDCPGVKGSRVQISPARQHDDGLARLIRANSSGYWAILDKPECLVADWAHQREYAAPTSRMPGDPGRDSGSSPPGLDGQP
jgi:hypothetical protein